MLRTEGSEVALPLLHEVVVQQPENLECRMVLGQLLLDKEDAAGVVHLNYVMQHDHEHALIAWEKVYGFLVCKGDAANADRYAEWRDQYIQQREMAYREERNFLPTDHLEALVDIAHRMSSLIGTTPDDPALLHCAQAINEENRRVMHLPLPEALSAGREVFVTTIMVHRRHLPNGMLSNSIFPLLIHPTATEATIILPSRYWASALLRAW